MPKKSKHGSARATESPKPSYAKARLQPGLLSLVRPFLAKKEHFLGAVEIADLQELFSKSRIRRFAADQSIFSRGDPGDGLYVILEGRVGIRTISFDGKEIILNILDKGEVFGEIAVLDGKERTAGAVAMEAADLLFIDRETFMDVVRSRPRLCLKLLEILCGRLRWTSAVIEDAYFHDLRSRLARRLLNLAKSYGATTKQGIALRIKLSQDDLGRMLGVTRESVSKEMGVLQRRGIVSSRHASIVIRDLDALERVAALN